MLFDVLGDRSGFSDDGDTGIVDADASATAAGVDVINSVATVVVCKPDCRLMRRYYGGRIVEVVLALMKLMKMISTLMEFKI